MMKVFCDRLLNWWAVWPTVFVAGCVGLAVGVINDSDVLEGVGMGALMLSLVMMALVVIVALLSRNFRTAVATLFSAVCCMVVGFLLFIMIGAGQHHPPRQLEEEEVVVAASWAAFDMESEYNQLLGTDIPKGSWWTDGQWYYKVKRTGTTILLEGYTLHEGGGACAFKAEGDSALYTAKPREGYTTFAEIGRRVTHHLLRDEAGDSVEVLIAYDETGEMPVAALQRFDGDELAFELGYLHERLAATYEPNDEDDVSHQAYQWLKFNPDGTVQSSPEDTPRPYQVELAYHTPTDVLVMPDGKRVGYVADIDSLRIYKAVYNDSEEYWESTGQQLASLPTKSKISLSLKYLLMEMFNNNQEEEE